jgi:phage tail sheath protein FI
MPSSQQRIPGVYREEIFPAPAPELITGVPAFLGYAEKGNVNKAEPLTLWPQFAETFGQPLPEGYLYRAVEGFFSNGGRLCYAVRLQQEGNISPKDALSNALQELESLDAVDLICAPDIVGGNWATDRVRQMQVAVLQHCERMGDRFAILDSPNLSAAAQIPEILEHRQHLQSPNAALYFPWIKIESGSYIPPCGHIAGVYARSDGDIGPHQAPTNYVLEGVLDLQFEVSDTQVAALNSESAGVNVLRAFRGRGIRIWGARTLSSDPIWGYINVRRLFLTAGRWIERNLRDVAFEPNDYKLWVRIERELTAYFQSLFERGALKGSTPQEGFYVKCDAETNPPEMRDAGKVVTEIGLAPTIPNEFIVVRLIHGTTGVSMNQTSLSQ